MYALRKSSPSITVAISPTALPPSDVHPARRPPDWIDIASSRVVNSSGFATAAAASGSHMKNWPETKKGSELNSSATVFDAGVSAARSISRMT